MQPAQQGSQAYFQYITVDIHFKGIPFKRRGVSILGHCHKMQPGFTDRVTRGRGGGLQKKDNAKISTQPVKKRNGTKNIKGGLSYKCIHCKNVIYKVIK